MNNQPQIVMTIKDRNITIFECEAEGCKWSRLAIGTAISTESEALEHLKTHDENEDK